MYKKTGEDAKVETKDNADQMIVDSGTTKTVAGVKWMNKYLESLTEEEKEKLVRKKSIVISVQTSQT